MAKAKKEITLEEAKAIPVVDQKEFIAEIAEDPIRKAKPSKMVLPKNPKLQFQKLDTPLGRYEYFTFVEGLFHNYCTTLEDAQEYCEKWNNGKI